MRASFLILAIFGFSVLSFAQPVRVADIKPGPGSGQPSFTTIFSNRLIFFADNGSVGNELYFYNGLTAPALVYDINFAAPDGFRGGVLGKMPELLGKIYFAADNGTVGNELWSWDGSNNPSLVKDLNPGVFNANPHDLVTFNNKIYFAASNITEGDELWVYDPFPDVANSLGDLNPGTNDSHPQFLTPFQNKLYFTATDLVHGSELFVYDPIANATTVVMDIEPGATGSAPADLAVVGNRIYFSATTAANGRELYSFDGTNVVRLTDLNPGAASSLPVVPAGTIVIGGLNGIVYFQAQDATGSFQLYRYVPGTNTTALVHSFYPGNNSMVSAFCVYEKRLFFSAATATAGQELWSYDGINTPVMIADINPGTADADPVNLVVWDSVLYFTATGSAGAELYRYKDTVTGIEKVNTLAGARLYPNPNSGDFTVTPGAAVTGWWQVIVTDLLGRNVHMSDLIRDREYRIILNDDLKNGVYVVRLQQGSSITNIPVTIIR